jgi:predicted nucleotidyltransferase
MELTALLAELNPLHLSHRVLLKRVEIFFWSKVMALLYCKKIIKISGVFNMAIHGLVFEKLC